MIPTINQNSPSFSQKNAEPICVIGAGTSGILTLRALQEQGLKAECFEMSDRPGGLWVYNNIGQTSGAYASLRIDSSKKAMAISDHPFPDDVQDFPNHQQVQAYLSSYANKFGLTPLIHFRHEVVQCERLEQGYRVQIRDLQTQALKWRVFSNVVVSNGHHHKPAFPQPLPSGNFVGESFHSQQYRSPQEPSPLTQQRVLVVGFGNSAADIAVELSKAKSQVSLSVRRGAWVLPRYLFGKPIDQGHLIPYWIPGKLRRWLVTFSMRVLRGKMTDYGLPKPDHLIGEAHPTLSDELPGLVKSAVIKVYPKIVGFAGKDVLFSNGVQKSFDTIIYCTGYELCFPFLAEDELKIVNNSVPLYLRIFHPERPHLFFIGLAQTIGPIIPVAERQAQLLAAHLAGKYHLPSINEMKLKIQRDESALRSRFVASPRHTMQLDPPKYLKELGKEQMLGSRRLSQYKKN